MKSFKFAENLKYYRKQAGLTQSQLAAHFNSDKSLISNYENGKTFQIYSKCGNLRTFSTSLLTNLSEENNLYENIKIAENIRFFRKQAGLTQEELAARFGSRKTLISNYEIGRNTPDIETLWELADIFDITIDELVGRE